MPYLVQFIDEDPQQQLNKLEAEGFALVQVIPGYTLTDDDDGVTRAPQFVLHKRDEGSEADVPEVEVADGPFTRR